VKQGSNKDGRCQDEDHRTVGEESQETSNHRDTNEVDGVEFVPSRFFSFRFQTDFPFFIPSTLHTASGIRNRSS